MIIYKTTNLINNKIYIGQHECSKKCKIECDYLLVDAVLAKEITKLLKVLNGDMHN